MYQLAQFAGPTCAACLVLTGILYTVTKLFSSTSEGRVENALSAAEYERHIRIEAENRADAVSRERLRWRDLAHQMRLGWLNERFALIAHMRSKGVEPPPLALVPEFPEGEPSQENP